MAVTDLLQPPLSSSSRKRTPPEKPKLTDAEQRAIEIFMRVPADSAFVDEDSLAESVPEGQVCQDPGFPPNGTSIYGESPAQGAPIEWRRLIGQLYMRGPHNGDLAQGSLHNSWFLGALAMVATRQELLWDLLLSDECKEKGLYMFRFFKNGSWHTVVVDDFLPCSRETGQPVFAKSRQPGELWPSLLEKAYAKLHGSYMALNGGNVSEALVDLTGGSAHTLALRTPQVHDDAMSGRLWLDLMEEFSSGHLLGCSFSIAQANDGETPNSGIESQGVYPIIDMRETSNGQKLVKLRDPWGLKRWSGAWSHESDEWTKPENAGLAEELGRLGHADVSNATWIAYEDLVTVFNKVYICRVFPASWHHTSVCDCWLGPTAGGCPEDDGQVSGSWCQNPQYALQTMGDGGGAVYVSLMRQDTRTALGRRLKREERNLAIALSVLRAPRDSRARKWKCAPHKIVKQAGPFKTMEAWVRIEVEAAYSYVIVPCTLERGQEAAFTLRTSSEVPLVVERLPGVQVCQLAGSWGATSAGGARQESTWGSNPQWALEISGPSKVMITLRRTDSVEAEALEALDSGASLGLCVIKRPRDVDASARLQYALDEKAIIGEAPYVSPRTAVLFLSFATPGNFVLVPSTAQAGVFGEFEIVLSSSTSLGTRSLGAQHTVQLAGEWSENRCGGCDLHDSWSKNPRYLLTVTQAARFRITVRKLHGQWQPGVPLDCMLGFYVLRSSRPDGRITAEKKAIVAESAFVTMAEVSEEVDLEPHPAPHYVIMPATYGPGKAARFIVLLSSDSPFTLTSVDH